MEVINGNESFPEPYFGFSLKPTRGKPSCPTQAAESKESCSTASTTLTMSSTPSPSLSRSTASPISRSSSHVDGSTMDERSISSLRNRSRSDIVSNMLRSAVRRMSMNRSSSRFSSATADVDPRAQKSLSIQIVDFEKADIANGVCYLADNMIRRELIDLDRILRSLHQRKFSVGKYEADQFSDWFRGLSVLIQCHLEAEDKAIFPLFETQGIALTGVLSTIARQNFRRKINQLALEVLEYEQTFYDPNTNCPFGQLLRPIITKCLEMKTRLQNQMEAKERAWLPHLQSIPFAQLSEALRRYFRELASSAPIGAGFLFLCRRTLEDDDMVYYQSYIFPGRVYPIRCQLRFKWFMKRIWVPEAMEVMSRRATQS